jgi:hypothetical protein
MFLEEKSMISNHIHDALSQVHTMQELVISRRRFQGYSGKARLGCGASALLAAAVLDSGHVPQTVTAHLIGWGIVLLISLILCYGSLLTWFLSDSQARRNPRMLKPAIDAIPALAAGAAVSVALILHQQYDLLPGVWMIFYGLAQVAYRQSLPAGIYAVGLAYLAAGIAFLLLPGFRFTNPWPMGIIFFCGEICGGIIMHSGIRQTPNNNHTREEHQS